MKTRRAVGLLATLVLALFVGASSASASTYQIGAETATITAEDQSPHEIDFTTGTVTCLAPPATGSLTDGDNSVALAPEDQACGSQNLEFNGCAFVLYPGPEIAAGEWKGKVSIDDAPGETCTNIVIDKFPTPSCEIVISPTAELMDGVTFEAVPGEVDTVRVELFPEIIVDPEPGGCGALGTTNYEGAWDLSAESGEFPVDLSVKSPLEWGEPVEPFDFEIEIDEPGNQVFGEQAEEFDFIVELPLGDFGCESAAFDSATFAGEGLSSATLALNVQQEECWIINDLAEGSPASVDMNGCQYVLSAGGTLGVSCPAEEKIEMEVEYGDGCLYTIGSQSGVNAIEYANTGSGTSQGVEATLLGEGTKMAITKEFGKFLDCGGTKVTRHAEGTIELSANSALEESIGLRTG